MEHPLTTPNPQEAPCPLCGHLTLRLFHTEETSVPWQLYAPDAPKENGLRFFQCEHCCLISKSPEIRPTPEQERRHYEKHNNDIADSGYRSHLMELLSPVAERVKPGANGLDYGSGPTLSLEPLARELGLECCSFDPLFAQSNDLLRERTYDFVLCCEVLEHFRAPRAELRRVLRLLKPGGLLAVKTQAPPAAFATWWYHRDPTHVSFFSPRTFEVLGEVFGLTLVLQRPSIALFKVAAGPQDLPTP